MNKTTLKIAAFCLIAFAFAQAAMADDCSTDLTGGNDMYSQIYSLKMVGTCTLNVGIRNSKENRNVQYPRSFAWTGEGGFSMNVVVGKGPKASKNSGVREYHIIPTNNDPTVSISQSTDHAYTVNASGMNWNITKGTPDVVLPPDCNGNVNPPTPENHGGVEIQSCKNKLVMDSGWSLGANPDFTDSRQTTIRDPAGHSCSVGNSEIFKHSKDSKYDMNIRFTTNAAWYKFLKARCSNLSIGFLLNPPATAQSKSAAVDSTSMTDAPNPAPSSSSGGAQ